MGLEDRSLLSDLVLWHDEALLVVNKPAGLPTLVDGYDSQAPYLVAILKAEWAPLWVVHRLDRQTSGVILFARTAQAHRSLNSQFEKRQARKVYHALVVGSPTWQEKSINLPLRTNADRKHRTIIDPQQGKPAHTDLSLLEDFNGCALVAAHPHTGRTHQIRAHLAAAGHPILMDPLYFAKPAGQTPAGNTPAARLKEFPHDLITRLALHALEISFTHPTSGQDMRFSAPYADDFYSALAYLRQNS